MNEIKIENQIYFIRGHKVMFDEDLAEIYKVKTKVLNQAVKRNSKRFPNDFMFQLTEAEADSLRSQIVTLENQGRGRHRKYLPFVFTEHGTVMLASILNSEVAIQASIQIIKAFVKLREILITHKEFAEKLALLEDKYDEHFKIIFEAIRHLMNPPNPPRNMIGF